ncbi:MAG: hypothetical protein RL213_269 [Bacteroidota bacterium]
MHRILRHNLSFLLAFTFSFSVFGQDVSTGSSKKSEKKIDNGKAFFEKDSIHSIRLNFPQCNYWDSLAYYKKTGDSLESPQYMQASVTVDGKLFHACGVRFKGESSYQFYPGKKKPFRIKFDKYIKGQNYTGLREINLNNNFKDPTMMREKIFLDLMKKYGLPAPRCTYAKVYLNDKYLGLYLVTENIDDVFLQTQFGDIRGNLYQGEPVATLAYIGNDPKKYEKRYILRNNRTKNEWSDLIRLIRIFNDSTLSDDEYARKLDANFDVNKCLKAWAIDNIMGNIDAYNMFYPHNFFLFHDSLTMKWHWITLDGNYAFAAWNPILNFPQLVRMTIMRLDTVPNKAPRPLLDKMLVENKYLRKRYLQIADTLLRSDLQPEAIGRTIDSLSLRIRVAVYADVNKMYSNTDFDTNIRSTIGDPLDPGNFIPGLKSYITERRKYIEEELNRLLSSTP